MLLTEEQMVSFIKKSFNSKCLPVAQCSNILLSQLAYMPCYGGMNYPFQFVEREISHLEGFGKTQTKPDKPFNKNGKLRGFWHKHFMVRGYGHLGINTKIAWELYKETPKKFSALRQQIENPHASQEEIIEESSRVSLKIAREIIYGRGGLMERFENEQGTGDWLIYTTYAGRNYYLCIAKHGEDEFILKALKACISDFPLISLIICD